MKEVHLTRRNVRLSGSFRLRPDRESDTPTPPKEATPEVSVDSTAAEAPAPTVLSMHYIDAAAALADDNLEKAKAALEALANESTGEMKTLAQAAANTGDIAAMREIVQSALGPGDENGTSEGLCRGILSDVQGRIEMGSEEGNARESLFRKDDVDVRFVCELELMS